MTDAEIRATELTEDERRSATSLRWYSKPIVDLSLAEAQRCIIELRREAEEAKDEHHKALEEQARAIRGPGDEVWVAWRDNDTFDFEIQEILGVFSTKEAAFACKDSWAHGDNLNNWITQYVLDITGPIGADEKLSD